MLTVDRLRELLHYDPETGVFVRLKATNSRSRVGDIVGSSERSGHRRVRVDVRRYSLHRLAWLYMTGSWPTAEIDQIDGNPDNNSFRNLREATRAENGRNRRLSSSNTSGYKGVHWDSRKKKWRALIYKDKKRIHIGHFDRAIDAFLAYAFKALAVHGEFANLGLK